MTIKLSYKNVAYEIGHHIVLDDLEKNVNCISLRQNQWLQAAVRINIDGETTLKCEIKMLNKSAIFIPIELFQQVPKSVNAK